MKLKDVSLDKLKTIQSLCDTGSITKSAQKLYVTPSAVSQSLVSFEDQLGNQLFIRRGKSLLPTAYCEKLIQIYQPFYDSLESFLTTEDTKSQIVRGQIRIFIPGVAGSKVLSAPFSEFLNAYPEVTLSLDSGPAPKALQMLYGNNFDFAICGMKNLIAQHKWSTSTPLFVLSMNLYCSKDYYQKHRLQLRTKNFDSLHFVSGYQSQTMLNWYFEEILGRQFQSPTRISIYDMNFMAKATIQGVGVGLLARELVADEIDKGELIEVGPKALKHPIFLVYHKRKALTPAEKTLRDFLIQYFQ